VRYALDSIIKNRNRVSDVVDRICDLVKRAPAISNARSTALATDVAGMEITGNMGAGTVQNNRLPSKGTYAPARPDN